MAVLCIVGCDLQAEIHFYFEYIASGWDGEALGVWVMVLLGVAGVAVLSSVLSHMLPSTPWGLRASMFLNVFTYIVGVYAVGMALLEAVERIASFVDDVGVLLLVLMCIMLMLPRTHGVEVGVSRS